MGNLICLLFELYGFVVLLDLALDGFHHPVSLERASTIPRIALVLEALFKREMA